MICVAEIHCRRHYVPDADSVHHVNVSSVCTVQSCPPAVLPHEISILGQRHLTQIITEELPHCTDLALVLLLLGNTHVIGYLSPYEMLTEARMCLIKSVVIAELPLPGIWTVG